MSHKKSWFDRNFSDTIQRHRWLRQTVRWGAVLDQTYQALADKNISLLSAGIAYYGVLAFFPLMIAIVAVGSIVLQPANIDQATTQLSHILPSELDGLLKAQLENSRGQEASSAAVAALATIASIVSVSFATGHIMSALDIMYNIKRRRSWWQLHIASFFLTLGLMFGTIATIGLLVAGGRLLDYLGVDPSVITFFDLLRWPILILIMMFGLAILYRIGPSHPIERSWRWVSWGAVVATGLWIIASAGLFIYIQYFADLGHSYSLFAGMIALMLWLNVSAYIMLLGAEINYRLATAGMNKLD